MKNSTLITKENYSRVVESLLHWQTIKEHGKIRSAELLNS
jgi:hypothetical protein